MVEAYYKGIAPLNSRITEVNSNVTGFKDNDPQLGVATSINDWAEILNWMGIASRVYNGNGTMEQIKAHLNSGQPIIGFFYGRYSSDTAKYPDHVKPSAGHAMVIVGYNDAAGTVTVSDPGSGGNYYRSFSYDIFLNKLWTKHDMVAALYLSANKPVTPAPVTPAPVTPEPVTPKPAPDALEVSVSDIGYFTSTADDPNEKGLYLTVDASGGVPPYEFDGIIYIDDVHMAGFMGPNEGKKTLSFGKTMPSGSYRLELKVTDSRGAQKKISQPLFELAPIPDPLTGSVIDFGFFSSTADEPNEKGVIFAIGASGGVPPYHYSVDLFINEVNVGFIPDAQEGEISVSFGTDLPGGIYRVELKVTDSTGTKALSSNSLISSEEPIFIPGDTNGDETIDILDLVAIIDFIVSGTPPASEANADATGEGVIDILDLVWVIDQIVGG